MEFQVINFQELISVLNDCGWSFDCSVSSLLNKAKSEETTIFEDTEYFNGNHCREDMWITISYHHATGLIVVRECIDRSGRHIHGDNLYSNTFYYVLQNRL